MKKITLLTFITITLVGCRYKRTGANVTLASNPVIVVDENTQDSCEYYPSYGHKGTCKFCAERRKKELDSLALKIWEGFE